MSFCGRDFSTTRRLTVPQPTAPSRFDFELLKLFPTKYKSSLVNFTFFFK